MLQKEIKYFGNNGGGDFDSADFAVDPNDWVNAENIRTGTTDAGVTKTVEAVGSTILRSVIQPSVTFIELKAVEDVANKRLIRFLYNVHGPWHKITCYDLLEETEYTVLLSSQVTGGLDFSKNFPIHSAFVIGDIVYWTEGTNNEPRRLNINAGLNLNNPGMFPDVEAYTAPLEQSDITWIRRQPGLVPTFEKQIDPDYENNFIAKEAFQFCYRYISREYEPSTLSGLSLLANYNNPEDTFEWNYIIVEIPLGETIRQDVQQVDLVAKSMASGTYFIIKSWNKSSPTDLAEIQDHNNGTTPLTFDFYNDFIGIALDAAYSVKPFDSLPIYAWACESARNRAFMANYIIGYDTPISVASSLIASPNVQSDSATITGRWVKISYNSGASSHYFLDIQGMTTDNGFYDVSPQPTPPPYPTSVNFGTLTFIEDGPADFALYVFANYPGWVGGIQYPGDEAEITSAPAPPATLVGATCFKSAASYNVSIHFMDEAGRKCGVVTPATQVNVPEREYDQPSYTVSIDWSLSNANAINEIPDWAHYFSIDITKCLRTRFFLQMRQGELGATYVTIDATTGEYEFTTSAYAATLKGCAFDITSLQSAGMGYVFTEGDFIKIYMGTDVSTLRIVGQEGIWVITELENLGTLNSSSEFLFEIYTPYKPSVTEPFFEIGELYEINNPGTASREYGTLAGSIPGDIVLKSRDDGTDEYLTENMSPNDKFYNIWNTSAGRPNFIDTIGQVTKDSYIAYSNAFIQGAKANGLCTFDALDTKDVPNECGSITRIINTSKVQNEIGVVMLALCESETVSIYLGEQQLVSQTGNAFIAAAPEVLGTMNVLKGSFGCADGTAVAENRGNVYFWDRYNGKIIQYSVSGLFPISNYKMTRYWKLFSAQFNSMTRDEIEALGSRPFVFFGVDPHHWELLITVPKLLETPPKGYLPDYPDEAYPFDIWDGQAKTLVFKLNVEPNKWDGSYRMTPEGWVSCQNKLFSSKFGQLYEHNSEESFCEFYGVQYSAKIMFVANQQKAMPKTYNNFSVNGTRPDFVYFRSEVPYVQASDLVDFSFTNLEGNYYAVIMRNKLVPTATGLNLTGLATAEKMRTTVLRILMQWNVTNTQMACNFVSIGYQASSGHENFKPQ